jgi:hypothetical protein
MKCKALWVQTIYGGATAIASDRSILELGTCPSGKSNKSGRFGDAMTTLPIQSSEFFALWAASPRRLAVSKRNSITLGQCGA